MLVADSKPLTKLTRRRNNLQQIEICNRVGQIPLKMDLASDTMWTLSGITLVTYMHIWLVEFKGYFAESQFFQTLWKTFSSSRDKYGMKTIVSSTLVHPSKFYLRSWNVGILR